MRNSVDELFVEGSCNVIGVNVWRSLCFNSGILGYCGVFLLVKFLFAILLRMGCGRSWSVLLILPTGMCFLPAW